MHQIKVTDDHYVVFVIAISHDLQKARIFFACKEQMVQGCCQSVLNLKKKF